MGNPSGPYPGEAPPPGFAVPPPAYGHPQQQTVTIVQSTTVGPEPTRMVCPHCSQSITTDVKYVSSSRTHLFALLLCLICPLGCCLIPYCMDSCMSASHTCPNCNQFLGTFNR